MNNLPDWLTENEIYEPHSDRDGFMTGSILKIMGVLSKFRTGSFGIRKSTISLSPCVKILYGILLILLCSLSHNMFFTYTVLAVFLIHLCFLNAKTLFKVFIPAVLAAGFSCLILIPAVFIGSPSTMLTVSIKVFLSAGLIQLAVTTSPWNSITSSLRTFHIPDIFIFTLDIAIRYIVLLGEISLDLLNALKLRAVGKNRKKRESLSGILGFTFIKAHIFSGEMSDAMTCRCFDGDYHKSGHVFFSLSDLTALISAALVILFFIWSENL